MEYITEEERKTPVSERTDVLVAGGGIAGASAALAAARMGKRVTLLEREFMLGGLGTLGLVTIYLPLCDGEGRQVSFGIAEELLRLSVRRGAQGRYPAPWLEGGTVQQRRKARFEAQYNPWLFAVDLERTLREAGVHILYGTAVCGAVVRDGSIAAAIVENKSGRSAVAADAFVDATGDADLCRQAGAETALYAAKNVLASWYYFTGASGLQLRAWGCADLVGDDPTAPLADIRFGGLDADENSRMLMLAREKMLEDIEKYREERDKTMEPVSIPAIPELRMTRRLCGVCELDDAPRVRRGDSVGCIGNWRKAGPAYEIPFSCLYGGQVKNLIAAGRCISVTDAMWDVTRVIPVCAVTGQAAGTAAAMCGDFASLDVKALQTRLERDGVMLHL